MKLALNPSLMDGIGPSVKIMNEWAMKGWVADG
jgi:hypothetical protein